MGVLLLFSRFDVRHRSARMGVQNWHVIICGKTGFCHEQGNSAESSSALSLSLVFALGVSVSVSVSV